MNLCGGITGISEYESILQIPDEEYNATPRKKKSSSSTSKRRSKSPSKDRTMFLAQQTSLSNRPSSRSRSRSRSRSSRGLTSMTSTNQQQSSSMTKPGTPAASSSMLNPVSRHNYDKLKPRQHRSQPLTSHGHKSSSILTKKLEYGFNLTWLNNGGSNRLPVNLSTNSDKSYLRIRMRSRDEEESENDSSILNRGDIKIKVRHISRVGSETAAEKMEDNLGSSDKTYFVVKMKNIGGESNKFTFLAQSLAERDTVVLAIRSLIDPGMHSKSSRTRKVQSNIDHKIRSEQRNKNVLQDQYPAEIDKCYETENSFSEFNTKNQKPSRPTNLIINSMENKEHANDSRNDEGIRDIENSEGEYTREENIDMKVHDDFVNKLMITKKQSINKSTRRPNARIEKNDVYSCKTLAKKDTIIEGRIRPHSSSGISSTKLLINNKKSRSRSPRELERKVRHQATLDRKTISMDGITDSTRYESFACNPIGGCRNPIEGCQSQALAAVEDGDLADLAATCTNPVTGPWCADDVCTVTLKDFADSMTGIFELKQKFKEDLYVDGKHQKVVAEEYISGFLSNNTNMSELLSVNDLWNVAAVKPTTGKELKDRRPHNRARNADGKAIRLKNLRKQMTFKAADTKNMTFLQTTSSFDAINNRKEKWNSKKSKFQDVDDSELLYYDSDPEDARERTMKCGPRVAMARRESSVGNETNSKRREALNILDSRSFGLGRRWKRLGQEVLSDIIEATKNERFTLIWHPTQNDQNSNMPPVCVKVWVESGIYLTDGTFLLPKLTWLPVHESNLNIRVLNVSDETPGSLDLLDVCRVRECESIDRKLHPFAHLERSFVIQTQKGRYMFETQSKQERGRVVNGLKLVIARLASLLMLRDLRAVDEFFGGNSVPGEAPAWANDNDNDNERSGFPVA